MKEKKTHTPTPFKIILKKKSENKTMASSPLQKLENIAKNLQSTKVLKNE
jgi:hypothetical protein